MFLKTMNFCNKGVVQADPPPPKDHIFTFLWDPSLKGPMVPLFLNQEAQ